MNTTRLVARRSIMTLLVLLLSLAAGGCGRLGGAGVEASAQPDAGETEDSVEAGADTGDADDASDQIAFGEITDPSESEDPDPTTPDTAPQNESRRLRAGIQGPLEQGQWMLAEKRATAALERTDLDPDFRLELEAYRDLARAAGTADKVAAGDALDRLDRFEPEFVLNLAQRRVLPESIQAHVDVEAARVSGAVNDAGGSDPATEQLDALANALANQEWTMADRLAGELLAKGDLTSEDTARVRIYEELAEAHLDGDAVAIARATESLGSFDPDFALRLERNALTVDPDVVARSDE